MAPSRLASRVLSLPPILHKTCQMPISACSKGSWGLSVLLRVRGIFTTTTISPGRWLRQCSCRYAFHAGRNLPDKELRSVCYYLDLLPFRRNAFISFQKGWTQPPSGWVYAVRWIGHFYQSLHVAMQLGLALHPTLLRTSDSRQRYLKFIGCLAYSL